MKKIVLASLLFFAFNFIIAQEDIPTVNKYVLGGSMGFNSQSNTFPILILGNVSPIGTLFSNSTDDVTSSNFSFTPYFGKEINPNVLIGAQLHFGTGSYDSKSTNIIGQPGALNFERSNAELGFGIFTRYTFNPEQRLNFFLQPFVEYRTSREEVTLDGVLEREEKANFIQAGMSIGALYSINDRVRATLRAGVINYINGSWEIVDTDTDRSFSSFGANLNLANISFGVELRL